MPKPYVIEPPKQPRQRLGSTIIDKLDEILEHVRGDGHTEDSDGAPEVTFEPEPSQLPKTTLEEEPDESAETPDNGEGTTNPVVERQRRFGFPGRRLEEGQR